MLEVSQISYFYEKFEMYSQSKILQDLKQHLIENLGGAVKDVILFGSQTTKKATNYSDYDVLIILNRPYSGIDENRILDLCYDINLKHDIILDIHILSESEINSVRGRQSVYSKTIESGLYA